MLYEICAVFMIFIIIFLWIINPTKELYKKYGGKLLKVDDTPYSDYKNEKLPLIYISIFFILSLFFYIIEILFMFWTAAQGVILAKYFALFMIIYYIFNVIYVKIKNEKNDYLPKKQKLSSVIFSTIKTFIMIVFIIWALIL